MSTLQPDHAMKDSSTYLPILRSVLKSQIQFLVEQLSDAGEETLILSANITDGEVDQLGSESGKLFVDVYDDFKSEFLGFCQRRKAKRKLESPQKTPLDAKRGKTVPAVLSIPKATVQSVMSPQNVPKVSAARVIVSQKPTTTQARSVPGNQLTQESSDEQDIGELEQSEEDYQEMEGSELGYEALEDVETWQGTDTEEGVETPSSSQDLASSSQEQSSISRVRTVAVQKKTVTTQKSKRGSFACDECGKVFAQKVTLKTHSLRHGEKTYHCKCGKSFFTKTELNNHNRFMHFEGGICTEMKQWNEDGKSIIVPSVKRPNMMPQELEKKPPKKRFVCRFCDVRYARKENLTIHIKKYHENDEPEFYCNICDKYFYARKSFKAHNRRHGEKNFQCSKCSKLFVTEAELNLHETHGHRELRRRKFKCNKCGKSFTSLSSQKRHSVRHGEKKLRCDKCWKRFYTTTELKQHMNCMHYVGEKKPSIRFACDICEATYARKENLIHHIKVIHEKIEKEIICEICNKGFSSKWSLWVHKKRHGEKTVQCSKCAKFFYTVTELHQHDKHSHNKEKKPEIKTPTKDQNTPINLEKMFSKAVSCGECGKLFIRADALELHVLSHTGEYPFTCKICGLGYRKKRSYIIHMTKKHPEVPLEGN